MGGLRGIAAEPMLQDWAELAEGERLPNVLGQISLTSAQGLEVTALNTGSEPANPFPGTPAALFVRVAEGQPFFRGWCRAFTAGGTSKGSFEFQFRVMEGGVSFTVGQNAAPFEPPAVSSFAFLGRGDEFLALNFVVGEAPTMTHRKVRTSSVEMVAANENYLLRVDWDFTSETPGITCFLNGEPLESLEDNAPLVWTVQAEQQARGIDSFSFSSTSPGVACFGSLKAQSGN